MLTLGVPPSVAQRGGFSAADALFDGCECLGYAGLLGMQWSVRCGFLCMQCGCVCLCARDGPAGGTVCVCLAPEAAQRSHTPPRCCADGPGGGLTWHKAKLMLQKHHDKLAAAQQQGRQG